MLDALTDIAKALSGPRVSHKSILFVGSDIPLGSRLVPRGPHETPETQTPDPGDCAPRINPARDRLTRALDEANVAFHAIDTRGLETIGETAEADRPVGVAEQGTNLYRQELLTVLPEHTGGQVVLNSNTPWDHVVPILDESRAYYVLAIARDPHVLGIEDRHQVTITVKKIEAIVRTRNLSFTSDPTAARPAPNPAAAAMADLLPRRDLSLQMKLVTQFSPEGSPTVRVFLGVARRRVERGR